MSLGNFLSDFLARVENGAPPDACVLCGSTTRLLHPVGRAWACSRCHRPAPDTGAESEPAFVFEGTFDALAASRGWYDHGRYRWVVYPVPDTGACERPCPCTAREVRCCHCGQFGEKHSPPAPDTGAEP